MKITKQQLINIIKEEVGELYNQGRYRQASREKELYDLLKVAIGDRDDGIVKMVLQGVLDDRRERIALNIDEAGKFV